VKPLTNRALIKLRKSNEAGQEVGVLIINTDQIVAITTGQNATEIQMADGRPRWVKETLDEVAWMSCGGERKGCYEQLSLG
jgi:hypothetical protein